MIQSKENYVIGEFTMKKSSIIKYTTTSVLFVLFIAFTLLVALVGKENIGPNNSSIGLATINSINKNLTYNEILDKITDISIIIALAFAGIICVIGIYQWIKRKSLKEVDFQILLSIIIYAVMFAFYVFFELVIVNYRPILIDGQLEASYPSSHVLFTLTTLITAIPLLHKYLNNKKLIIVFDIIIISLCLFTMIARLLCGIHWLTDILGAVILSATLIMLYFSILDIYTSHKKVE